jgi:Putative Actinobacterial Holin-X, holin superfamily III
MATEVQDRSGPGVSSLLSGIVTDMQELIKQQFHLTRREMEEDLRKSKEAASLMALGAGICFLGAILLCFMGANLLHWLASPPLTDPASFPLWACHGVVGVVLVFIGGSLAYTGRQKLKSVHPLENPASQALKENVQWLTTPK